MAWKARLELKNRDIELSENNLCNTLSLLQQCNMIFEKLFLKHTEENKLSWIVLVIHSS